jgi:hypothetical protein
MNLAVIWVGFFTIMKKVGGKIDDYGIWGLLWMGIFTIMALGTFYTRLRTNWRF